MIQVMDLREFRFQVALGVWIGAYLRCFFAGLKGWTLLYTQSAPESSSRALHKLSYNILL